MFEFKDKGRLLADSAFTTYFGKPAFHTYGNGNRNPVVGGLQYGSYMKTHSVNPHSGANKPEKEQVHYRALMVPKVRANRKAATEALKIQKR